MPKAKVATFADLLEAIVKSKFKGGSFHLLTAGSRSGVAMEVARQGDFRLVVVKTDGESRVGGINLITDTNSAFRDDIGRKYALGNEVGFNVKMSREEREIHELAKLQDTINKITLKAALQQALMGWLVSDIGRKSEYRSEVIQAQNKLIAAKVIKSTEDLMALLNGREALASWFTDNPPK